MSDKEIPMFKANDKAMIVYYPQWNGSRTFRTVEIGKVHKTGRLTLKGSKTQWSFCRGYHGDSDHFTSRHFGGRLFPWSYALAREINAEIKMNKIGVALSRVRDLDQAAELWAVMPDEFKALIKEDNT